MLIPNAMKSGINIDTKFTGELPAFDIFIYKVFAYGALLGAIH